MAAQEVFMHFADLFLVKGRIQEMGDAVFAAIAAHQVDLVLHERDQRADYNGYALADDGGKLVAKAFAAACRHDDEGILTG